MSAELFKKYKETGDVEIRNEIVLCHMNTVKGAALSMRNIYAKYGDAEDLVNEGVIALISAVETFDPDRGAKFETYAALKVKGAIIDYVRKQDWVPRQIRKFGKELEQAYGELYNRLDRHPKNQELADYMGLTKEQLASKLADTARANTLSFEELLFEDNFNSNDGGIIGDKFADRELYEKEQKQVIADAVESLKPKERQVVALYYYEKLKFAEIAKVLGVTESRVCQIHSKAMLLLKRKLEDYMYK